MNNKSGVFLTWFQNFAMLVFTQSFHAVFMVFVLKMMHAVAVDATGAYVTDRSTGILAIVSIAGAQALIKFEKIIKDLFGIGDSKYMGNLSKNFAKTAAAVGSGVRLAQRTAEPFKGRIENKRKVKKLEQDHKWLVNGGIQTSGNKGASPSTNPDVPDVPLNENSNNGSTTASTPNSPSSGDTNKQFADLIAALNNNTNALSQNTQSSEEDKKQNIRKEYEDAKAAASENFFKMFTRGATTIAAAGIGMGATDEFSEAVTVANLVDAPLDWATDKAVERHVYKDRSRELGKELAERQRELDEINKKNAKAAPAQKVDTTNLEKAIKDLKETKIAMDDKVPETLRRELASLWKDVKVEVAPSAQIRRIKNSVAYDRDKRNNVDDI